MCAFRTGTSLEIISERTATENAIIADTAEIVLLEIILRKFCVCVPYGHVARDHFGPYRDGPERDNGRFCRVHVAGDHFVRVLCNSLDLFTPLIFRVILRTY